MNRTPEKVTLAQQVAPEEFEERAAIIEFEGGYDRDKAEEAAADAILKKWMH